MAEDRCESVGSWPLVHVHVCFCPVAEIFSHASLCGAFGPVELVRPRTVCPAA